jgi:hypothetical protein
MRPFEKSLLIALALLSSASVVYADAGSGLQVVRGPDDIATNGSCITRMTAIVVRATRDDVKGVYIAGGSVSDADSKASLPSEAFELLRRREGQNACPSEYEPIPADSSIPKDNIATLYLRLRDAWSQPGNFAGDLLIAPQGASGAETLRFKVFFRPLSSWFWGLIAILVGSLLSWVTTIWWPRKRQMAVNEVLIARLDGLLDQLGEKLKHIKDRVGLSVTDLTIDHIKSIRSDRLKELRDDTVLTVLTGSAPSAARKVGVIDEIEGVSRVVNAGFVTLFSTWETHRSQQVDWEGLFRRLDALGARPESRDLLEPEIKRVLDDTQGALVTAIQLAKSSAQVAALQLPEFEQEGAVVQRVIAATAWLDVASITAIVLAGGYALIWKNPGFGTWGDLFVAFFWGLGLKVGADTVRITGGDVRTAMGIKIPTT